MRLALLTAHPELARGLFPRYFDAVEVPDDPSDVGLDREGTAYDFTAVEWESPQDMGDAEFEMLRSMLGNDSIIVTAPSEATEGVDGQLRLNSEPGDSEWT